MNETIKHRIIRLVAILLFQILLCNNIHILGYASPIVLPYLTMKFHRGSARESLLIWGFVIGLIFDIFSNTMGKGMASCTLLGMLQPYLLRLFSPNESVDMLVPSFKSMGFDRYIYYAVSSMLIFHHVRLMVTGALLGTALAVLFTVIADVLLPKDANID